MASLTVPLAAARARVYAPAVAAAAAAMLLSELTPVLGALLLALLFGALVANSGRAGTGFLAEQAAAGKWMLRAGVVVLGLRLPLQEIVRIGFTGVLAVVVTVGVTYAATLWLGARLGLSKDLVALLAAGFSICGAAAVAAVSDVVRARERDVALAVGMVTIFGGLMIVLLPFAAGQLALDNLQTAVWAGASIHEVAQVAAAASIIGGNVIAFAMLIKLGRVAMLAPVTWTASRALSTTSTGPKVPWFIVGFAVMATVRSIVPLPEVALQGASVVTTLLLAGGMFGLGIGLRVLDLWPLPLRVFFLAAASTAIAAATSLVIVIAFF